MRKLRELPLKQKYAILHILFRQDQLENQAPLLDADDTQPRKKLFPRTVLFLKYAFNKEIKYSISQLKEIFDEDFPEIALQFLNLLGSEFKPSNNEAEVGVGRNDEFDCATLLTAQSRPSHAYLEGESEHWTFQRGAFQIFFATLFIEIKELADILGTSAEAKAVEAAKEADAPKELSDAKEKFDALLDFQLRERNIPAKLLRLLLEHRKSLISAQELQALRQIARFSVLKKYLPLLHGGKDENGISFPPLTRIQLENFLATADRLITLQYLFVRILVPGAQQYPSWTKNVVFNRIKKIFSNLGLQRITAECQELAQGNREGFDERKIVELETCTNCIEQYNTSMPPLTDPATNLDEYGTLDPEDPNALAQYNPNNALETNTHFHICRAYYIAVDALPYEESADYTEQLKGLFTPEERSVRDQILDTFPQPPAAPSLADSFGTMVTTAAESLQDLGRSVSTRVASLVGGSPTRASLKDTDSVRKTPVKDADVAVRTSTGSQSYAASAPAATAKKAKISVDTEQHTAAKKEPDDSEIQPDESDKQSAAPVTTSPAAAVTRWPTAKTSNSLVDAVLERIDFKFGHIIDALDQKRTDYEKISGAESKAIQDSLDKTIQELKQLFAAHSTAIKMRYNSSFDANDETQTHWLLQAERRVNEVFYSMLHQANLVAVEKINYSRAYVEWLARHSRIDPGAWDHLSEDEKNTIRETCRTMAPNSNIEEVDSSQRIRTTSAGKKTSANPFDSKDRLEEIINQQSVTALHEWECAKRNLETTINQPCRLDPVTQEVLKQINTDLCEVVERKSSPVSAVAQKKKLDGARFQADDIFSKTQVKASCNHYDLRLGTECLNEAAQSILPNGKIDKVRMQPVKKKLAEDSKWVKVWRSVTALDVIATLGVAALIAATGGWGVLPVAGVYLTILLIGLVTAETLLGSALIYSGIKLHNASKSKIAKSPTSCHVSKLFKPITPKALAKAEQRAEAAAARTPAPVLHVVPIINRRLRLGGK